jgi:hypothetical protein
VVQCFALRAAQLWYGDEARWVGAFLTVVLEQISVGRMYDTSQDGLTHHKRKGLSPGTDPLT